MRLLFACLMAGSALAAPPSEMERAQSAYLFGDYKKVIDTLLPVLYPTATVDPSVEIAARRLLGLSYLFERDEENAEKEFLALLRLDPDFTLDPLIDPPPFVEFFNRIRAAHKEDLAERQRRQEEAEKLRRLAEQKEAEERAKREEALHYVWVVEDDARSPWLALVPFGVGQFQNGQPAKGTALLITEAALGAASLSLALTVRLRYPDGTFPNGDVQERDTADALVSGQVITGALFFGVAIYGAIDALYYFGRAPRAPPKRVPRERFRLTPRGLEARF